MSEGGRGESRGTVEEEEEEEEKEEEGRKLLKVKRAFQLERSEANTRACAEGKTS